MKGSASEAKSSVPEGATAQRWDDLVKIKGAKKAKILEPGKEYEIHRLHLKGLIKKGEAEKA